MTTTQDTQAAGAATLTEARQLLRDAVNVLDTLPLVQRSANLCDTIESFLASTATAPSAPTAAFEKALELRMSQGWQLGGNACPVLYTDSINGEQVMRDDLWIATTAGLKGAPDSAAPSSLSAEVFARFEPDLVIEEDRGRLNVTGAAMKRTDGGRWVRYADVVDATPPAQAPASMSAEMNHCQWLERVAFFASVVQAYPDFDDGIPEEANLMLKTARGIEAEANELREILEKGATPSAAAPAIQAPEAVADPEVEYIHGLIFKLESFIDHATGGKLSKSSWALETLKAAHDEHLSNTVNEAVSEALAAKSAAASDLPADEVPKDQAQWDRVYGLIRYWASRAREAEASLAAAKSAASAAVAGGHANAEAEWIAQSEHLNCPACGGSGHIDDVKAPAAVAPAPFGYVTKDARGGWHFCETAPYLDNALDCFAVYTQAPAAVGPILSVKRSEWETLSPEAQAKLLAITGAASRNLSRAQAAADLLDKPLCTQPPEGWTCSRGEGHEGPCASAPMPATQAPAAVTSDKLWCETCDGTGKVHQEFQKGCHVGGEHDCPDCDGNGYWTRSASMPAGAAVGEWQPIETAPKGQNVLLYRGALGRIYIDDWGLYDMHNQPKFTHWMPLPAAPLGGGER